MASCCICNNIKGTNCMFSSSQLLLNVVFRACKLYRLLELQNEYYVCCDCCNIVNRCAKGIYFAKMAQFLFGSCFEIRCLFCYSSRVVKELRVVEDTMKYFALERLNGYEPTVEGAAFVCLPCDELLEDLAMIYQCIFSTFLDKHEEQVSEVDLPSFITRSQSIAITDRESHIPFFEIHRTSFVRRLSTESDSSSSETWDDDECIFELELEEKKAWPALSALEYKKARSTSEDNATFSTSLEDEATCSTSEEEEACSTSKANEKNCIGTKETEFVNKSTPVEKDNLLLKLVRGSSCIEETLQANFTNNNFMLHVWY